MRATISTKNWSLQDINNFCFNNGLEWNLSEEQIELISIEVKMEEQITAHFEAMSTLVSQFEDNVNKKLALENKLEVLKQDLSKFENDTKMIVNNEVDDKGKKVYSNEEMRNIATNKILSNNETYRTVKKEQEEKERELNYTKAQITMLDTRLSVMKNQSNLIVALTEYKVNRYGN